MKLILDTNRYTDLARGDATVVHFLEHADMIYLPFVAIAELRGGFAMGKRGRENETFLRQFILQSNVTSLYPDEQTTVQYAAVYRHLRRQGTPIPTNDIWIAALTLQHGLKLYARDKHFDHIPQLARA